MSHVLTRRPRRRLAAATLLGGLTGSALLALSLTGTLSAFTAALTNSPNTVTTGSLILHETDGTTECVSTSGKDNSATCTIDLFTGTAMLPGGSATKTVTLANKGTVTPSTFTLSPKACAQSGGITGVTPATDFCELVTLKLYAAATATGTAIYDGKLSDLTKALSLTALAPKATQGYTFTVSLPANLDNTYQGLTASQQLIWAFTT